MDSKTYFPKTLTRFNPKVDHPINLKMICMDAVTKQLTTLKLSTDRDCRRKKAIRRYLNESIPLVVQKELIDRAVGRYIGTEKVISIMELLEPKRITSGDIDLVGSFRFAWAQVFNLAYGCYYVDHRLFWSNGTIERLNLNPAQCDKLYNLFLWGSPKNLNSLCISLQRKALQSCSLESIFSKCINLTKITILNGATDHVLRVLGTHCPKLKFLDFSHSCSVTDEGLRGLLFRAPKRLFSVKNPCAKTLNKLILLGTEVSKVGVSLACDALEYGYSVAFLPDNIIIRPSLCTQTEKCIQIIFDLTSRPLWELGLGDVPTRGLEQILRRFLDATMDNHQEQDGNEGQAVDFFGNKDDGRIFIRPRKNRLTLAYLRVQSDAISELILPWDNFIWTIAQLPEVTDLAMQLPNLKILKSRVQGTWDRGNAMFTKLEETYIWVVHDVTVYSFLQWCPCVKTFKFNCLNFNAGVNGAHLRVTDNNLQASLQKNQSLRNCLEEFSLRPAPKLTVTSIQYMVRNCPNLTRLGDMESWAVSAQNIRACNAELDRKNSKCILTVLSFPPKIPTEYLL